jgi:DNA-directed RNA polymerase alpha subunit
MISFNGQLSLHSKPQPIRSAELDALDALLGPEFDDDFPEEPAEEEWPDEEPLPVSAIHPPVLTPDVLDLPERMADRAEMHLAEIGLTDRTLNTLEEAGLHLVGELLYCRPEQLLALPQFGPATLDEVYRALSRLGFCRKS